MTKAWYSGNTRKTADERATSVETRPRTATNRYVPCAIVQTKRINKTKVRGSAETVRHQAKVALPKQLSVSTKHELEHRIEQHVEGKIKNSGGGGGVVVVVVLVVEEE